MSALKGAYRKNWRGKDIMDVPLRFMLTHFAAVTRDNLKFVYCPVGNIVSWNDGDYDHRYCAYCKQYFEEVQP
jgi:hypothetical protein